MQSAKDVLEKGTRRIVSNGEPVKIWKEQWLDNQSGFRVQSPVKNLSVEATMFELIDLDTKQWKIILIHASFSPYEANQIISIAISQRLPANKLLWQ